MKVVAKVTALGPVIGGTSSNGIHWEKQTVVVETIGLEAETLAIEFMGERKTQKTQALKEGDQVEVSFVINCHEYNERWYTRLDGLNIRVIPPAAEELPPAQSAADEELPY